MKRLILILEVLILIFLYTCCIEILPGSDQLILGRNMQIGQIKQQGTDRGMIFQPYTYAKHKVISLNGTTFLVADQIFAFDFSTEEQTSINEVYTSELVLQESMALSYSTGYNSWFMPGMFSTSYNSNYFRKVSQSDSQYMASSYLRITNYKAQLNLEELGSELKLNPFFEQLLFSIPDSFNQSSCPHFKQLFNTFGTHYVLKATLGGADVMSTTFDEEILQDTSTKQVQYDLNQQFFLTTTTETLSEEQQEQLIDYNAEFKSTFELIGGDPSKFSPTDYQPWIATVLSDPLIVGMEIYNFTTFLMKNKTENQKKIDALNIALVEYFFVPYESWQKVGVVPYGIEFIWVIVDDIIYFPISNTGQSFYYNIKSNLWFRMEAQQECITYFPGCATDVGQLPMCTAVGDLIYCFILRDSPRMGTDLYSYNTKTNVWLYVDDSGYELAQRSVVSVGSYIYIMGSYSGGVEGNTDCSFHWEDRNIIVYNTVTDTYDAFMIIQNECISEFQPIVLGNDIYTFGGRNCKLYTSDCETFYYVMSNATSKMSVLNYEWTTLAPMPARLYKPGITVLRDKIYVMGGSIIDDEYVQVEFTPTFQPNYNVYVYDTITDEWSTINSNSAQTAVLGIAFSAYGLLYYMASDINLMSPTHFC